MSSIVATRSAREVKTESGIARLLGSGMSFPSPSPSNNVSLANLEGSGCVLHIGSAGIAELAVFHPVR